MQVVGISSWETRPLRPGRGGTSAGPRSSRSPPPAAPDRACNSSYVEAALAAMMARVMIASNRTDPLGQETFLSAQHVLDCSQYGQGCAGGTPFEVGKFSEDFGILITDYYIPDDRGNCVANRARRPEVRYYFSNYGYLGSYYGNTNVQDDIIWEIYRHGPVVASVYANADWDNCDENSAEDVRYVMTEDDSTPLDDYSSGSANRSLRHFYASNTNHTVLIVGWGSDEVTGDYWLVLDYARPKRNTCDGPLRKISRGVNAYNIEAEVVVMYWAPYPDFLHPEEYFLMVRCSTIVLMAILLLIFSLISIVSIGVYICLRIRMEKEHRRCISISNLETPQEVMSLIPSGQAETSADTSPVLLDDITSNCGQEESEELSMLSNP